MLTPVLPTVVILESSFTPDFVNLEVGASDAISVTVSTCFFSVCLGEVSIAPQDGQLDSLCHTSALHSFPVPCASGNGIAEKATECQEESWPCLPQDGPGNVEEDLEMVMGEMRKSKPTEDYYCRSEEHTSELQSR